MIETRGIAKLDTREYLAACPAVTEVIESNGMLEFKFDQAHQPAPADIPDGVFFDLTEAPF